MFHGCLFFYLGFRLECGKEDLFQGMIGASFYAGAASHTLSIIDHSQIILDGNSTLGAEFFALSATDTGVYACGAGVGALVAVAAHDGDIGFFRHHGDDVLGADGGTHTATQTKGSVDVCDAILHTDGFGRAS